MFKQYKHYIPVFVGALALVVGCASAMEPVNGQVINRKEAFLAFLAGQHSRLGAVSPLQCLTKDVARAIGELLLKDIEIISEDETSLNVALRQAENGFDCAITLGCSYIHPKRRHARQEQNIPILHNRAMVREIPVAMTHVVVSCASGGMAKNCLIADHIIRQARELRVCKSSIIPVFEVNGQNQRQFAIPLI